MGRKAILERRKARLEKKRADLIARSQASEDIAEVRAINDQLMTIAEDLQDIVDELATLADDGEGNGDGGEGSASGDSDGEGRSAQPQANVQTRGCNPIASYGQATQPQTQTREGESYLDTMEYRTAFANYVRTGVWNYEQRDSVAGMVTTADIGKIIPFESLFCSITLARILP